MKTFEFTDREIIALEKALSERISRKRRVLKNLEHYKNGKTSITGKDLEDSMKLYEKFLEIIPDKYMFGKRS